MSDIGQGSNGLLLTVPHEEDGCHLMVHKFKCDRLLLSKAKGAVDVS